MSTAGRWHGWAILKRAVPAGIGGRFVAFALVCVVVPLAAVGAVAMWAAQRAVEQEIFRRNQEHVRLAAQQVAAAREGVVRELQLAAQSAFGLPAIASGQPLEALLARTWLVRSVAVTDAGGQVRLRLPEQIAADRAVPATAWAQVAWSRVPHFTTLRQGGGRLFVAVPLLGPGEQLLGMAGAELNREALGDLLEAGSRRDGIFAFLVDGNGHLIVGVGDLPVQGAALEGTVLGEALRQERSGTTRGRLGGQESLISYQPVPRSDWGLVVGRPVAVAFGPVRQVTWLLLQGLAAVVVLGLLFSWLGSRRVTRPLARLTALAARYGRGELWQRVEITGDDEVGRLARTMNDMGQALDEERARVVRQQKYLQDILQSLPLAVVIMDSAGRVTGWNRAAAEMTGFAPELVQGLPAGSLPIGSQLAGDLLAGAALGGRDYAGVEAALTTRGGEQLAVRLYTARLTDQRGTVLGTVAVLADVTAMKQMELLVRRSERLSALGQLAAGMAHELKNPLAVLSALAQTLAEEAADGEFDPLLIQEMGKEIGRMNALLVHLLDLGREEPGQRERLCPGAEADRLLTLLHRRLRDQGVEVVRRDLGHGPPVLADRARVRQAFLNILVNSLEAMPGGGVLTVQGLQQVRGDRLYAGVAFTDTGPGIPEKYVERIFDPFYSTKQSGTGLGLAVVHEIMAQHGGEVLVHSRPGEGATFTCWFPAVDPS